VPFLSRGLFVRYWLWHSGSLTQALTGLLGKRVVSEQFSCSPLGMGCGVSGSVLAVTPTPRTVPDSLLNALQAGLVLLSPIWGRHVCRCMY